MNPDNGRLTEAGAWFSAGLAGFSFWQGFALGVTIIAGLISIMLGLFRLHDRLKYGPRP